MKTAIAALSMLIFSGVAHADPQPIADVHASVVATTMALENVTIECADATGAAYVPDRSQTPITLIQYADQVLSDAKAKSVEFIIPNANSKQRVVVTVSTDASGAKITHMGVAWPALDESKPTAIQTNTPGSEKIISANWTKNSFYTCKAL